MQKFVTEIFKAKIGWLNELMNIFKFIENLYSPQINSQFKPEDPTSKFSIET